MPIHKTRKQVNKGTEHSKKGISHILSETKNKCKSHKINGKLKKSQTIILNEENSYGSKILNDSVLNKKLSSVNTREKIVLKSPLVDVNYINNARNSSNKSIFNIQKGLNSLTKDNPQKQLLTTSKVIKHKEKDTANSVLFVNTILSEQNIRGGKGTKNDNLSSKNENKFLFFKNKFKQPSKINKSRVCDGDNNDNLLIFQYPSKFAKCKIQENVTMAPPTCSLNTDSGEADMLPSSSKRKLPFKLSITNLKKNKKDFNLNQENHNANLILGKENDEKECALSNSQVLDLSPILESSYCFNALNSRSSVQSCTKISESSLRQANYHTEVSSLEAVDINNFTTRKEPAHNSTDCDNTNEQTILESHSPVLDCSYYSNAKHKAQNSSAITEQFSKPINAYHPEVLPPERFVINVPINHSNRIPADVDKFSEILPTPERSQAEEDNNNTTVQEVYSPILDSCDYKMFSCQNIMKTQPLTPYEKQGKTADSIASLVLDSKQYNKFDKEAQNCNKQNQSRKNRLALSQEKCYQSCSPILGSNRSINLSNEMNSLSNSSNKPENIVVEKVTSVNEENNIQFTENNYSYNLDGGSCDKPPICESQNFTNSLSPILDSSQYKIQPLNNFHDKENNLKKNNKSDTFPEKILHNEINTPPSPVLHSRQHEIKFPANLQERKRSEGDYILYGSKPCWKSNNKSQTSSDPASPNHCKENIVHKKVDNFNQEIDNAHFPLTPISPVLDSSYCNSNYLLNTNKTSILGNKAYSFSEMLQKNVELSQNQSEFISPSPVLDSNQLQLKKTNTIENILHHDEKEVNKLEMLLIKQCCDTTGKYLTNMERPVSPILGFSHNSTVHQDKGNVAKNKNKFALGQQKTCLRKSSSELCQKNLQQSLMPEKINSLQNKNPSNKVSRYFEDSDDSVHGLVDTVSPILNCRDLDRKFATELQNINRKQNKCPKTTSTCEKIIDHLNSSNLGNSDCKRNFLINAACSKITNNVGLAEPMGQYPEVESQDCLVSLSPVLDSSQLKYKSTKSKNESIIGKNLTVDMEESCTNIVNLSYFYSNPDTIPSKSTEIVTSSVLYASPILSDQQIHNTQHNTLPTSSPKVSNASFLPCDVKKKSIESVGQNSISSPTLILKSSFEKGRLLFYSDLPSVNINLKTLETKYEDVNHSLGPMLCSGIGNENQSRSSEFNGHCNVVYEEKKCSAFDSELDIMKFPINFSEESVEEQLPQNLNFISCNSSKLQRDLPSTNLQSSKEAIEEVETESSSEVTSTKMKSMTYRESSQDNFKCSRISVNLKNPHILKCISNKHTPETKEDGYEIESDSDHSNFNLVSNKKMVFKKKCSTSYGNNSHIEFSKSENNSKKTKEEQIALETNEPDKYSQLKMSVNQRRNMYKELSIWKSRKETFEYEKEKVLIEDYDDESSCSEDNDNSVDKTKLNLVKRNLTESFELDKLMNVNSGLLFNNRSNEELNFELESQDDTLCGDMLSGKSTCIQEELTQESASTQIVQIECSSSPQTKSLQETQSEEISESQSFPPPLNVPDKKPSSLNLFDSASKTRRSRWKKGSLVDRLNRLVRAESAEVNMFHHEEVQSTSTRVCSLLVDSIVTICSRLLICCHYSDSYPSNSEEFSAGEEVLDPEVRVFIDPNFVKKIFSGSRVLIHPPWHSLWLDGQAVMLIYGVKKVQVVGNAQLPPLTNRPAPTGALQYQYYCQTQDEVCGCRHQLMTQIFGQTHTVTSHSWPEGSIMAALAGGRAARNTCLHLLIIHRFTIRSRSGQVTPSMLCLDSQKHVCQINLLSQDNANKLETLLKESSTNTFYLDKLAICKRVNIDRARGLRSILSLLHPESCNQQILYVASLFSDQWSAQMIPDRLLPTRQRKELTFTSIAQIQDEESRVSGHVCVIAQRGDHLYVWERNMDSYHKVSFTSSAVLPKFSARDILDIRLLLASHGELIIDKYSEVRVAEEESVSSQFSIPQLSIDASEGDLVLLDSVVSKVNSDVYLRWTGDCGHALLKLQGTGLFYCSTCSRTVTSCHQRLALEVGVVVTDVTAPIRLKVKNETAQTLILGSKGEVSSNKCYNMIGAIGSSLKCVALVLEVLKNQFGDILEFHLEEL